MLLHDTAVRERGFGIWRLWEEIAARYPGFELPHSPGLGIAYVGSEPLSGALEALFGAKTDDEVGGDSSVRWKDGSGGSGRSTETCAG